MHQEWFQDIKMECTVQKLEILCMKHDVANHMQVQFIWVFTVCKSTSLGVSSIQKVLLFSREQTIKDLMAAKTDSCLCYSHSEKSA